MALSCSEEWNGVDSSPPQSPDFVVTWHPAVCLSTSGYTYGFGGGQKLAGACNGHLGLVGMARGRCRLSR
eukprot:1598850-Rhodomonas_salina.2